MVIRGVGCQSFVGRWRVFWMAFGAVGIVVVFVGAVGVFEESEVVPSFDGLVDFVAEPFYLIRCAIDDLYRSS